MRKFAMTSLAFAAALTAGAAMASGEDDMPEMGEEMSERRIDIKGGVFFPPVVLAETGDVFVIRNDEDTTHNATAIDGSWTTGPIYPGQEVVVVVGLNMTMCFESTVNDEYKGAFGSLETGEAPGCFELSGAGDSTNGY